MIVSLDSYLTNKFVYYATCECGHKINCVKYFVQNISDWAQVMCPNCTEVLMTKFSDEIIVLDEEVSIREIFKSMGLI